MSSPEPIEGVEMLDLMRELYDACTDFDEARRVYHAAQEALTAADRRVEVARGRKLQASVAIEHRARELREQAA